MGRFLDAEKIRQADLKKTSPLFSEPARRDGIYKGKPRPFCLPLDHAEENLFPAIRQSAMAYFAEKGIKWHDGKDGTPSNHLCDSQVCCVNFLFPFADKPDALLELLHPLFPTIKRVLPMEESGELVSFEWIGKENYLGEKIRKSGKRTRGANFTSADAAVMFETTNGSKQIVLIEWKYTESYGGTSLKFAKSGTDRSIIYAHLFERDDCPINKDVLPSYGALFHEPFYQLFRQQLLANEMEKASELGADLVSVLHIAPACNRDFRKVTSPELRSLGESATDVWKRLVKDQSKFQSMETEQVFSRTPKGMEGWREYVLDRYAWMESEEQQ